MNDLNPAKPRAPHAAAFTPYEGVVAAALDRFGAATQSATAVTGLATGLAGLDRKLGGLAAPDLVIVGGATGMGKTALAQTVAHNVARAGHGVAWFSLEMSAEQLAGRALAEAVGLASHKMRQGAIAAEDWPRVAAAGRALARLPIHIDDSPALSVATLRARARRLMRARKVALIVVDYLQLMDAAIDDRVRDIAGIARGLKRVAKELEVPVLALAQLSRAVDRREDKRPRLGDLHDSGGIEQHADAVLFVHREAYYLEQAEPTRCPGESDLDFEQRHGEWGRLLREAGARAEIIVAKQRNGPTGTIELNYDGAFTRFHDADDAPGATTTGQDWTGP